MFQRVLLLFSLLITLSATAQTQNALETTTENEDLTNISVSKTLLEEIFFTNPEKTAYFIDFEATKTQVVQLQLWKNQELLVLTENTSTMPYNTIYELNIEVLPIGEYTIELTTKENDVIIQAFDVKGAQEELVEKGNK
jgi:hypothetical protein